MVNGKITAEKGVMKDWTVSAMLGLESRVGSAIYAALRWLKLLTVQQCFK